MQLHRRSHCQAHMNWHVTPVDSNASVVFKSVRWS